MTVPTSFLPLLGRVLLGLAASTLLVLVVAVATLFSSGAPALSLWLVGLVLGAMLFALLVFMPAAGVGAERFGVALLLVYCFVVLLWPRYASLRLPGLPSLSLARVVLLFLFLVAVYLIFKSHAFRARLNWRLSAFGAVTYPLLALLIWRVVGIPFSEFPLLSLRGR